MHTLRQGCCVLAQSIILKGATSSRDSCLWQKCIDNYCSYAMQPPKQLPPSPPNDSLRIFNLLFDSSDGRSLKTWIASPLETAIWSKKSSCFFLCAVFWYIAYGTCTWLLSSFSMSCMFLSLAIWVWTEKAIRWCGWCGLPGSHISVSYL